MEHDQRMQEIYQHEVDFRQQGIQNIVQAHDDIDYLYTRVKLLLGEVQVAEAVSDEMLAALMEIEAQHEIIMATIYKPDDDMSDVLAYGYFWGKVGQLVRQFTRSGHENRA